MANRLFQQFFYSLTKNLTGIHGVISINSSAAVTGSTIRGASVAKTGTGLYTITLDDSYPALESAQFTLLAATAVDLVPQIVSADVVSAKTIVVRLNTGATATDPSAACQIHVALRLRNSSVVI
jgi:hypothetical protein